MYRFAPLALFCLSIIGCGGNPASEKAGSNEFASESTAMEQSATQGAGENAPSNRAVSALREAKDLGDILNLVTHAESLVFTDIGRNESGLGVTSYPQSTRSEQTIQEIAALIRDSGFVYDAQTSQFLRDGGTIDCMVYLQVKVDNKAFFRVFTTDYLLTAGNTIYVATQYSSTAEDSFARRLNQILDSDFE